MCCHCSFICISYRTFLSEDAGPSTLVATVRAKDPDGDGLLYLITGGNEEGNFELDSQKGKGRAFRMQLLTVSSVLTLLHLCDENHQSTIII